MPGVNDLLSIWQSGAFKPAGPSHDSEIGNGRRPSQASDDDQAVLLAAVGCHADKLRLVYDPVLVANDQAARVDC